jgi:hypothetical protein
MLGLFGLMVAFLALISLASYWISWDLQHKELRSRFATMAWDDFMDLVGKFRSVDRNGDGQWRVAVAARAKQEPVKSTDSILQRSDRS